MVAEAVAAPSEVERRLNQWRERLLDFSRRNPLFHFRPTRSGTVRIFAPDAHTLLDLLLTQEKALTFYLPAAETPDLVADVVSEASTPGDIPTPEATEHAAPNDAPLRPDEVRADTDPKKLPALLYRLRLRARSALEEQGVNTLYLAVGFLGWREATASAETVCSPLILVPVRLERETALDPFRLIAIRDDEPVLNPTLVEKLRRDFGLELPLIERPEEFSLAAYLNAIRVTVERQPHWSVDEEVYLGHFSFQKLAMYKDLQEQAALVAQHPVVQALAGVPRVLPPPPPNLPAAQDLDDKLPPKATYHFLDADSSQLEAITMAARGANLIIQGPPGTGKSQTIANLIAEALAQRRTVLFVSEKMAALEVVYRRLAERGLDLLCLEVHSHHADKRAVLEQLRRSLDAQATGPDGILQAQRLEQLAQVRDELNAYVRALHSRDNPLGISAFDAQALVAKHAAAPHLTFHFSDSGEISAEGLARVRQQIGRLQAVGHVLMEGEAHPWHGSTVPHASLQVRGEIEVRFDRLQNSLSAGQQLATALATALAVPIPQTLERLRWLDELLSLLERNPYPPAEWFSSDSLRPHLESAQRHAQQADEYRRRRVIVLARYDEGVFALPVDTLRTALDATADEAMRPISGPHWTRREQASDCHADLDRYLDAAIAALDSMRQESATLAPRLGLPQAQTLDDLRFQLAVTELILRDPRPTASWLERTQLLAIEGLAEEAQRNAALAVEERRALTEEYDPRLLEEAPALAERYRSRYGSFFRALKPSYWRDRGLLRTLHRAGQAPGPAAALGALERALRVRAAEAWLQAHDADLTIAFGHNPAFLGSRTDWTKLAAAAADTRALVDLFGPRGLPAPLRGLLQHGGADLVPLQIPYHRLHSHVEALGHALAGLAGLANVFEVAPDGAALDFLRQGLARWHQQLGAFWTAEAAVRARRHPDAQGRSVEALAADLDEVAALNSLAERLGAEGDQLRRQFGPLFNGIETDWQAVLGALEWTQRVKQHWLPMEPPADFVTKLVEPTIVAQSPERLRLPEVLDDVEAGLGYVRDQFEPDRFRPASLPPERAPLPEVAAWVRVRLDRMGALEEYLDYRQARTALVQNGLAGYIADLDSDRPVVESWDDAFLHRFYELWLDEQYAQVPALARFRGEYQRRLIGQFRDLDRSALEAAPRRVLNAVLRDRPMLSPTAAAASEPAILLRELQKKKRHKPIRSLFHEIPTLLAMLKPCLLMSPLSVSQYLDPARLHFDLVIFDEASQVLPEDAIGAIYRGDQLVVAGDRMQLPPTQFFRTELSDDAEGDEEAGEVFESILDQCTAAGMRTAMLRWHYRSRDEQLIAFSNHHFYGNRLVTFPSPNVGEADRAVTFVHVTDGVYDRGGSRTNRVEARRVAELVLEHFRHQPNKTLGVVAFSQAQMLAVLDEVERLRRAHPDLEPFFREDGHEPFFVKNLETVQGDERDVIVFSVGYGKDQAGKMSANFGPLNRAGGERRLNVAVTRAREHVKLVSSIRPEDIDVTGPGREGVRHLRRYMDFAIRGPASLATDPATSVGEAESPFESSVAAELRSRGLTVHSQVGCSGYRIDLAVVHRDAPGRYVLGVECDGATYHSSKTARERDRLRQQVLEGLGWRIHRIWSADWIKDRAREMQRVLDALDTVYDRPGAEPESVSSPQSQETKNEPTGPVDPVQAAPMQMQRETRAGQRCTMFRATDGVVPYVEAHLESVSNVEQFYEPETARSVIATLVARCVQFEGPVHVTRVLELVARAYGFQRAGGRIVEQIQRGIQAAVYQRQVVRRGEFLWRRGLPMEAVPVRRSGPSGWTRPIDLVAPEELSRACLLVLEENLSLPESDLIVQTARLLGYERTGTIVSSRLREVLSSLEAEGTVIRTDTLLHLRSRMPGAATSVS